MIERHNRKIRVYSKLNKNTRIFIGLKVYSVTMNPLLTTYFVLMVVGGLVGTFFSSALMVSVVKVKYNSDYKVTHPGLIPFSTDLCIFARSVFGTTQSLIIFATGLFGLTQVPGLMSCSVAGFFNIFLAVMVSLYDMLAAVDIDDFGTNFQHIRPFWMWIAIALLTFLVPFLLGLSTATYASVDAPFCLPTSVCLFAFFGLIFIVGFSLISLFSDWFFRRGLRLSTFAELFFKPAPKTTPGAQGTAALERAKSGKIQTPKASQTPPSNPKTSPKTQPSHPTQIKEDQELEAKRHEMEVYFKNLATFNKIRRVLILLKVVVLMMWTFAGTVSGDSFLVSLSGVVGITYLANEVVIPYLFFWRFNRHGENLMKWFECKKCMGARVTKISPAKKIKLIEIKTEGFDDIAKGAKSPAIGPKLSAVANPDSVPVPGGVGSIPTTGVTHPPEESKSADVSNISKAGQAPSSITGPAAFSEPDLKKWEEYNKERKKRGDKPYEIILKKGEKNTFEFDGKVSFFMLVSNPRTLPIVTKHAETFKTHEPWAFMLKVLQFKAEARRPLGGAVTDPGRSEMKNIIAEHIAHGSAQQVNVGSSYFDKIQEDCKDKPRLDGDEFDAACHNLETDTLRDMKARILADPQLAHAKTAMVRDILNINKSRTEIFRSVLIDDLIDPMPLLFCCIPQ